MTALHPASRRAGARLRAARAAVAPLAAAAVGAFGASCTSDYGAFLGGAATTTTTTTATTSTASGGGTSAGGAGASEGGGGSSAGGGTSTGGSNAGGAGGAGGQGGSGATGGANTGGEGGGPPVVVVDCGGMACPAGQACCYSNASGFMGCAPVGGCPANTVEISCDGPEDCAPADVCCGHWNVPENVVFTLACEPTCTAAHSYEYCHTSADCPASEQCFPSVIGGTFGYCF